MKIECLFLGILFALSLTHAANESPKLSEPDHLVPVNPYPGDELGRYYSEVHKQLNLTQPFYFQMLVRPSFSPEYVIRMHGDEHNPWEVSNAEKVYLTYSIAEESIWDWMHKAQGIPTHQQMTVSTITIPFPKTLADRLYKLWSQMLLRTRYSDTPNAGLDGTTYEFGMWCIYGQAWSPEQPQSPRLFIELGDSLIAYCKATPADRSSLIKSIEDNATRLETYLDKHK